MADDGNAGQALGELVKHILLATAAVLIIFAFAIGLDLLATNLVTWGVIAAGSPLHWALRIAKYFLLGVDLVLLIILVVKFACRAVRKF